MTREEIFDFYDENWNDYNKIMDMLHTLIDEHEEDIKALKNQLNQRVAKADNTNRIEELQLLLQQCQDSLDEETHKI